MALLGGALPLRIMSRRGPRNHTLDRAPSCSEAAGYYGMDRSRQFGVSAADVLEGLEEKQSGSGVGARGGHRGHNVIPCCVGAATARPGRFVHCGGVASKDRHSALTSLTSQLDRWRHTYEKARATDRWSPAIGCGS